MSTSVQQPEPIYSSGLRATLSTFAAMVRKEFIVMLRYPVEFVASFAQVFLIVIVLTLAGLMFAPQGVQSEGDSEITGLVVYGFVLFIYLSDTLWSIGFNVRREQKQGTLEQLYLSPASKFAALASRVALTLIWTGLLSVCAALVMSLLLGELAAVTIRIKEAAQTAVNLIQFGFMVLCAPFFPFSALPEPLQYVARAIPLAYGVDAFRSTLMGYPAGFPELASIEVELVIVTLFGVMMPLFGFWLYRAAENQARRKGSLSEY